MVLFRILSIRFTNKNTQLKINMTKKHFITLAQEISNIQDRHARNLAADAVARAARQFNPRFNNQKWFDACRYAATADPQSKH